MFETNYMERIISPECLVENCSKEKSTWLWKTCFINGETVIAHGWYTFFERDKFKYVWVNVSNNSIMWLRTENYWGKYT